MLEGDCDGSMTVLIFVPFLILPALLSTILGLKEIAKVEKVILTKGRLFRDSGPSFWTLYTFHFLLGFHLTSLAGILCVSFAYDDDACDVLNANDSEH